MTRCNCFINHPILMGRCVNCGNQVPTNEEAKGGLYQMTKETDEPINEYIGPKAPYWVQINVQSEGNRTGYAGVDFSVVHYIQVIKEDNKIIGGFMMTNHSTKIDLAKDGMANIVEQWEKYQVLAHPYKHRDEEARPSPIINAGKIPTSQGVHLN